MMTIGTRWQFQVHGKVMDIEDMMVMGGIEGQFACPQIK